MAYGPQHLPFAGFEDLAYRRKKSLDKSGGHYPLQFRVVTVAENPSLLFTFTYKNVWDRKPVLAAESCEWEAASVVTIEIWQDEMLHDTFTMEDVQPQPGTAEQLDLASVLGEE